MKTPTALVVRSIVLAAAAVALLAPEGFGHGGIVKPPRPVRPERYPAPGPGTPGGSPPPTTGPADAPKTGGNNKPQGPATGGGRGPTTPSGGPSLGGPRAAKTGVGGKKRRVDAGTSWFEWWRANRDQYYAMRQGGDAALTGRVGVLNGIGRTEDGGADDAALGEAQSKILFGLRDVLDDADADVVDSAIIAISRSVDPRLGGPLARDLSDALRSDVRSVRQAAILGFGMLAAEDAARTLFAVLDGGAAARAMCGGNDVSDMDRGLAAMSLGLLSDRTSTPAYLERLSGLAGQAKVNRELAAGLVLGAGVCSIDREAIAMSLGALLDAPKLDREIRALLPISLARLGGAAAPFVPRLLLLSNDRDADLALRRSSVIALGRSCTAADREVVTALRTVALDATDAVLRRSALIALGEIAERSVVDGIPVDTTIGEVFARTLSGRTNRDDTLWAALGVGLWLRALPETASEHLEFSARLATLLEQSSDPEAKAALALSLGLARAPGSSAALIELSTTADVAQVRACAAEGLGLLGDVAAADALREQLSREIDDEASASQALALGVLGDRRATAMLVERVARADSARTVVASALALGRLRDPVAVDPLLALARDGAQPGVSRAFAAIALGLIGERGSMRWNAPFCVGANGDLTFDVQSEVMDIL
jgi:hypothetical protein